MLTTEHKFVMYVRRRTVNGVAEKFSFPILLQARKISASFDNPITIGIRSVEYEAHYENVSQLSNKYVTIIGFSACIVELFPSRYKNTYVYVSGKFPFLFAYFTILPQVL